MSIEVIILAAGLGKRMYSDQPKVLHALGGEPLLGHVLDAAEAIGADRVHVVCGHGGDAVRAGFGGRAVYWVEQPEQRGTGHAVSLAMAGIGDEVLVLVMYGDVPLIRPATLTRLARAAESTGVALLTQETESPAGLGRILRDQAGRIRAVREERDASEAERAVGEINTGFMALRADLLRRWLKRLSNDNAQKEYYLTDIVGIATADGYEVIGVRPQHQWEVLGINDRGELARAERILQQQRAAMLMRDGVTLRDPARFDLRGSLVAGRDCDIDVNAVFEGRVRLGDAVRIGPGCVIRDSRLGDGVVVDAHSVIDGADIGPDCRIGPFARIRPGTQLRRGARIGNFVEVKKSELGAGAKANHLAYVGDSQVGAGVNIGAGVITCNYDGVAKHETVIGDGAFIGSDCTLVAPVRIGAGAYIAAGSTITRDAPGDELTIARAKQQTVKGWFRRARRHKASG